MSTYRATGHELDQTECWDLLRRTSVGRLAVSIGGHPEIFPINHVVHEHHGERCLVFRTGAGTKLAAAVLGVGVAYEIDGLDADDGVAWSVVVKGRAHQIEHMDEIWAAQDLPLFPWVVAGPPDYVRIDADEVTGRRFEVLEWAAPDGSIGSVPFEEHDAPARRQPYMSPD